MMRSFRGIFICSLLLPVPAFCSAADKPVALFLRDAEPGAHLYSMGRVFASLDPGDSFSHPWAWSPEQRSGITFSHWPGILDTASFDFAGAALKVPRGMVSVSLLRYSAGTEAMEEADGTIRDVALEDDLLAGLG